MQSSLAGAHPGATERIERGKVPHRLQELTNEAGLRRPSSQSANGASAGPARKVPGSGRR
jgi:hypothetical protein